MAHRVSEARAGGESGVTPGDRGSPHRPFDAVEVPWGYGENRVTAMALDPEALFLYWELTDEGIADARRRLGPGGDGAWCNLRFYDTTGRAFDGTNANDYFDIGIGRHERERFVRVDRPARSFHVEVGMRSHEGYFQPIARSGRVDFPRSGPSPHRELHWMTVQSDVVHPTARPYHSRFTGTPWTPPPPAAPAAATVQLTGGEWLESWSWQEATELEGDWHGPWLFGEWSAEWQLFWMGPRVYSHFAVGPETLLTWQAGPFPIVLPEASPLELRLASEARWPRDPSGRRLLATWQVHYAAVSPLYRERWWRLVERRRVAAFARRQRLQGGSEERIELGASELWRLGASERLWIGASEWLALGGSERGWQGASEHRWQGASEHRWQGASEHRWQGASEGRHGGMSEELARGGRERSRRGASDLFGGASERLGASEQLGASAAPHGGAAAAPASDEPGRLLWLPWTPEAKEAWATYNAELDAKRKKKDEG